MSWGDGEQETVTLAEGQSALVLSHRYDRSDDFTITVVAWDGELESEARTAVFTPGIPEDGLVLHYTFDPQDVNGRQMTDASGNTGNYESAYFATDRYGRGERAGDLLNGNNAGQLGLVSTRDVNLEGDFTIAAWIYADSNGNGERILGQGNGYNLYFASSSKVAFGRLDGLFPDGPEARDAGSHPDNTWTLYVGVAEVVNGGTELTLYRDGREVGSAMVNGRINGNNCRVYAGAFPESDLCNDTTPNELSGFPGRMDDVRIYDRALTGAEVQALFDEPAP